MAYLMCNRHNTLYIQPYPVPLPLTAFATLINRARIFVAYQIASLQGQTDVPLPPNRDPYIFGAPNTPVQVTWQSKQDKKMTWGELAAALRGLEDCLVKNQKEPYVSAWHLFGLEGVIGSGMIRPLQRLPEASGRQVS